jgi:hypothetical protein
MKKCPPGVICIENITMFYLFIVSSILAYLFYYSIKQNTTKIIKNEKITIKKENREPPSMTSGLFGFFQTPNYPYNNLPYNDVLLNPYTPPLKDERYLVPNVSYIPPGTLPINISTNIGAVDTNYRQLGILTPLNGPNKNNILPLMGRPLFTNRQKYQYYTISNQHNNIKLPVSVKGRSGTNEYGVDQIFNGDTVYVEGYNDAFKVTTYDNDTIRYLPSI